MNHARAGQNSLFQIRDAAPRAAPSFSGAGATHTLCLPTHTPHPAMEAAVFSSLLAGGVRFDSGGVRFDSKRNAGAAALFRGAGDRQGELFLAACGQLGGEECDTRCGGRAERAGRPGMRFFSFRG